MAGASLLAVKFRVQNYCFFQTYTSFAQKAKMLQISAIKTRRIQTEM